MHGRGPPLLRGAAKEFRWGTRRRRRPREFGTAHTPSTRPAPQNAGATRNFESWRQQDEAEEKFEGERKEAAEANAMSALESKTLDSKIEMDILDALDEIKAYNERHERVERAESYLANPTTGAPPTRCSRTHLLGLHTSYLASSAASITETRRPSRSRKSWARA